MRRQLTVVCQFRNEEVYLPYWLRHHTRLFDHGVLLDYGSTDGSVEIIRRLAPTWEVRPSRNAKFDVLGVDAEIMDVEREFSGWKMSLNVTEFLLHHDLNEFLDEFEACHPGASGLVTTGFIIQDMPEQLDIPLTGKDLWWQRHFGCPEPDPCFKEWVSRRRLLHRASHGNYLPGRHENLVSRIQNPVLNLFWYGWCPLTLKLKRNQSTRPMLAEDDLKRGWYSHHAFTERQVIEYWADRYLPNCYDLLGGRWPQLNAAIGRITRRHGTGI